MKLYKSALRWWISLASLVGFAAGWITLAHASEAEMTAASQAASSASVQAVPTALSLDGLLNNNVQLSPVQTFTVVTPVPQAAQSFQPMLRTGGS